MRYLPITEMTETIKYNFMAIRLFKKNINNDLTFYFATFHMDKFTKKKPSLLCEFVHNNTMYGMEQMASVG